VYGLVGKIPQSFLEGAHLETPNSELQHNIKDYFCCSVTEMRIFDNFASIQ